MNIKHIRRVHDAEIQEIVDGVRRLIDGAPIQAPPSALLALTELPRALAEWASLPLAAPLLATAPRGDGHPVLVLPGFIDHRRVDRVLRRYPQAAGL